MNELTAPIKMIALDLDGTTLASGSVLTERTKSALERAMEEGVPVVIATGRCFTSLPEHVLALKGLRYVVTSNGARIRDLEEDRYIYSDCLTKEAVSAVIDVLRANEGRAFGTEIFVDGYAYIDRKVYDAMMEGESFSRSREYVRTTRTPMDDLYDFALAHGDEVENMNIFFANQEDRAAMRAPLSAVPGTTFTNSFPTNWELGGERTSKARAVAHLMREGGVDKASLLACGDSPNDLAMLRLAGVPVAVGNAALVVKEAARFVAPSNDEDGVAVAIGRYLWGEEE